MTPPSRRPESLRPKVVGSESPWLASGNTFVSMPSRRRPKLPPAPPPTDAERFAKAVRDSEAAARRAVQDDKDRKAAEERRRIEAAEAEVRLAQARVAHQQA